MTEEQSEEHFERKTTGAIVAIDFEAATETKIPTASGQAMLKGMGVYRHKGQVFKHI